MDVITRLQGVNPTKTVFYSPEPRVENYCVQLNFKMSKLANKCHICILLDQAKDPVERGNHLHACFFLALGASGDVPIEF